MKIRNQIGGGGEMTSGRPTSGVFYDAPTAKPNVTTTTTTTKQP